MAGRGVPSRVRLFDSQENWSEPTRARVCSAAMRPPSGVNPVSRINHRSPLRVHRPSEYPPSPSNSQDRMPPSTGSHPMICQPSSSVAVSRVTWMLRVR